MYGPAYAFQKFNDFLVSWKFSHTIGIPYNLQGQVIVERTNRDFKEPGLGEAMTNPHLVFTEILSLMNFLSFVDKGLSPAYKHWASLSRNIPLSLVRWRGCVSFQGQLSAPLLTHGGG